MMRLLASLALFLIAGLALPSEYDRKFPQCQTWLHGSRRSGSAQRGIRSESLLSAGRLPETQSDLAQGLQDRYQADAKGKIIAKVKTIFGYDQ